MVAVSGTRVRAVAERTAEVIRIETAWFALESLDMRAGVDTALARVMSVFGKACVHHAYPFMNKRPNRHEAPVHDGFGLWLCARRLRQDRSRPISDLLHEWFLAHRLKVRDGSASAKAIDYSLKRYADLQTMPNGVRRGSVDSTVCRLPCSTEARLIRHSPYAHSPFRNCSTRSVALKRPGLVLGGVVFASAASFSARWA